MTSTFMPVTATSSPPPNPVQAARKAAPIQHAAERLTQRTVKFIRWLKSHLDPERDWAQAITRLNEVYTHL